MDSTSLAGHSILIVEDEPLIATDLADAFVKEGAQVVVARSLQRATELIEANGLSAAVVDFGLRDGDANSLCSRLDERDIPYVLHSGYMPLALRAIEDRHPETRQSIDAGHGRKDDPELIRTNDTCRPYAMRSALYRSSPILSGCSEKSSI